jgi:hypothetical protein
MGKKPLLQIVLLVLAMAGEVAKAADGLSLAQFQDRLIAEIHKQQPAASVTRVGEHHLEVQLPGQEDDPTTLNLDRAFGLYQGAPAELGSILHTMASNLGPQAPASADALLVLVRPDAYEPAPERNGLGHDPAARPLVGNLVAVVAVDRPSSYGIWPADKLRADLKLDDQAIWRTAMQNTRRRLNAPPPRLTPGHTLEIDDDLAASLLVLDEFWDAPPLTAQGPLVVAVFARDELLVAPLSDTRSVRGLRKLMHSVRDDPNGLTNDLIVRRNGRWEVLP